MELVKGLMVCFMHNVDRNEVLSKIVSDGYLGFTPKTYTISGERNFSPDNFLAECMRTDKLTGIVLESDAVNLHVTYPAIEQAPLVLTWKFPGDIVDDSIIEYFSAMSGFVCAYLYDYWDVFWQSAIFVSTYQMYDKSYAHVRLVKDKYDREVIDTSQNYGKQTLLKDLWLMAAPLMWFGPNYYKLVCPKSELLRFSNSRSLKNEIIFIQLDENQVVSTENNKTLRQKQKLFRDFINATSVESKLS